MFIKKFLFNGKRKLSKILGILASGKPVIATTTKDSELGRYVLEAGICIENNDENYDLLWDEVRGPIISEIEHTLEKHSLRKN